MKNSTTNHVALEGSSVAVYQTWEMGRDLGDDVRTAARRGNAIELKTLLRRMDGSPYVGSFDLSEDQTLEQLYVLLQNDSHDEGWVKALGAQDGWLNQQGASSLSIGDVLAITHEGSTLHFVVGMVGFIAL